MQLFLVTFTVFAFSGCASVRDAWTVYSIQRELERSFDPRAFESGD